MDCIKQQVGTAEAKQGVNEILASIEGNDDLLHGASFSGQIRKEASLCHEEGTTHSLSEFLMSQGAEQGENPSMHAEQFIPSRRKGQLVLDLVKDMREEVSSFFSENLRPRAEIGFKAETVDNIHIDSLVDSLESGSIRLQLAIQNLSHSSASSRMAVCSNEASKRISSFLRHLRKERIIGSVDEDLLGAFFSDLLTLRAELTSVLENWTFKGISKEIAEDLNKLQKQTALQGISPEHAGRFAVPGTALYQQFCVSRESCAEKTAPVEKLIFDLQDAVEELLSEADGRPIPEFGFATRQVEEPISLGGFLDSLSKASKRLEKAYSQNSEDYTAQGVERRVMIQNIQTGVDELRLVLIVGPFKGGVPEPLVEELIEDLEEYRESLLKILSLIDESAKKQRSDPRLAG